MNNVDLSRVDLLFADLSYSHMRGSNLMCARLFQADLTGVDLEGVNLKGVDLTTVLNIYQRDDRVALQKALQVADGDGSTRLPAKIRRPRHWPT